MPMTRLALNFRDFDDYLAHLSYGTRKSLRRKFRKTERTAKIELEIVSDITPHLDEVYPLYLAVHERSPMKFEKLTKEYLSKLGQLMPERVRFFIWRLDQRIIAFSICIVHDVTIYDEYLGLDYSVALDLHLYFYTLRDILRWAIDHRLTFYCSSPLNYDPKLHLGCDLAPLDLYVRHTQPLLNPIFSRVVKLDEQEWPPALQPVLLASQELAISAGARVARLVAKLRTQWPRFLKSRVALAGCLVGDGKMGILESDEIATPLVAEAVEKYAGRVGIRLVGFKDFPARTRSAFSSLNQAGYVRVTGFPPLILDLNFASFEEYAMKQLSRATRKNLRRKFRAADGA